MFILMQFAGGLAAVGLARFLNPMLPADAVVVPHDSSGPE
jgi:hypothetical protein